MGRSSRFFLVVAMLAAPGAAAATNLVAGGHFVARGAGPRVIAGRPRGGNQNQVTDRYNQEQVTNRYNQEQVTDRYRRIRDGRRGRDFGAAGYGGGGFGFDGSGLDGSGLAGAPPQGPVPVRGGLPLPLQGAFFAPPPRCPLIIEIGRGLRHPARTRVISGTPFCADR